MAFLGVADRGFARMETRPLHAECMLLCVIDTGAHRARVFLKVWTG